MNPHEEDHIRPPDDIVQDQLLRDDRDEFDRALDEAMYASLQELKQQREQHTNYEAIIFKQYEDERNRRTTLFKDGLFHLIRLGKYDKEVRDIVEIIDPIIDAYCHQFIETCELDAQTYENIFNTISRVRNSQEIIDALANIIIKTYE
ncbi:MAG: hypothetical protein ACOVRN_14855 [Flavobacterium sp.]